MATAATRDRIVHCDQEGACFRWGASRLSDLHGLRSTRVPFGVPKVLAGQEVTSLNLSTTFRAMPVQSYMELDAPAATPSFLSRKASSFGRPDTLGSRPERLLSVACVLPVPSDTDLSSQRRTRMLNKKIEAAMNDQLQAELQSAYVYLGMSAFAESASFPGMGLWLRAQWEEELAHAMKFYNFILDRGSNVQLKVLDAPAAEYKDMLDVFEQALEHERSVTRSINDLYALVAEEKDFASQAWLDWFATEQVEEEKSVGQIVDDLRRIGDRGDGLYVLDKALGNRTDV